jgi:hypothetical protein
LREDDVNRAVAAFGCAGVLLAMGAAPAAAADQHVVLFKDEDSSSDSCYDKDFWLIIEKGSNGDVTYVCFDRPGPL